MRHVLTPLALAAAILPATAHAADQLDCVSSGYSAQQQAVLDAHVAAFEISDMDTQKRPVEVISIIEQRAQQCARQLGWSDAASDAAGLYHLGSLTAGSIRRKHPEAAAVMDKIDTDLSDADRERFWSIMTSATGAGDTKKQPTSDDFMFIGMVIMRFQPDVDTAQQNTIGALMGMEALLRNTQATFSEL
ncbi:hypothetical protein [Pontixanthobacter sp.]|uniref:hypothetical protein n=1 Tax=Pontixanthobacter sp. TaxID=2792078 RepID=UPI003C7E115B